MVVLNISRLVHANTRIFCEKNERERDKINTSFRKRWEVLDRPAGKSVELSGNTIIKQLNHLLEKGFRITRSETQCKVHKAVIESLLPKIYGSEWDAHQGAILKSMNIDALVQEVMIVMARREGKSFSVGMALAAVLMSVPGVHMAAFATGKRMASALMDITKQFLKAGWKYGISDKGYQIKHANEELLHLVGPDGTDRILRIMPGTPKVTFLFITRTHTHTHTHTHARAARR